jgi:carbon-monoxide dehydrogenase medium subunit
MNVDEMLTPTTIDEVVQILAERGDSACVLAGGTDVMVRVHRGLIPESVTCLVSLHQVAELRGTCIQGDEMMVGATTTAADLVGDPLIHEHAPILATVADRVASAQIRNVATIGGNIVNASPAGDLINPLLLLDAAVVLLSVDGRRTLPVFDLFTGPGTTVLQENELLVKISFEVPAPERVFRFEKAGTRPSMECSVVTVGLAYTPDQGALSNVRVTAGACAPVPLRCDRTESVLEGQTVSEELIEHALMAIAHDISPITDVRGTESYRRALTAEYLRRMLESTL